MLDGNISGLDSLDAIRQRLAGLQRPNLRPLADQLLGVLIEHNRRGLMAGQDGNGDPFQPLSSSTIRREGSHTPLVREGEASPLIAGYSGQVEETSEGATVRTGWSGVPQLGILRAGTANMPARDPVGIRPEGREAIRRAVSEFGRTLIGGDIDTRGPDDSPASTPPGRMGDSSTPPA